MPLRPVLLAGVACLAWSAAAAQTISSPTAPKNSAAAASGGVADLVEPGDVIDFEADAITYADGDQLVTATGNVRIVRDGYRLTSDTVEYNRTSGQVEARGNVVTVDPAGNQAFGDRVQLTESLKDGAIDNILLVLNDGGRLAANSAQRINGISTLNRAVYSPCSVSGDEGCPREPLWSIKAVRIVHNPAKHRISYKNARLDILGVPIMFFPAFSHPDGSTGRASGVLLPEIEYRRSLGLGVGIPYNLSFGSDRDITIKPWIYTAQNPALSLQARQLFKGGPIQADAFFTYANLTDVAADNVTLVDRGDKFRGYLSVRGQLQHSARWRSTFSARVTTDDTFNRRYGLDFDDSLRSTYNLEHFGSETYLSVQAWAFQDLRIGRRGGETPIVFPLVDYQWRPSAALLGGHVMIEANSLGLYRTDGQRSARALASARWDRSFLTPLGQRITTTAMVRGDIYDSANVDAATRPEYAGSGDLVGRGIVLGAVDVIWPFAGPLGGGTQTITPRAQLVVSNNARNSGIPNEDARAVDIEDSNIFSLNRYPGFDRWEGGSRVTYGVEYRYQRPRFEISTELAQTLRIDERGDLFPGGTGLSGKFSDVVGRTTLKYGSLLSVTHRFRIDKAALSIRRNEIDIAVGSARTYATVGYIRLNRDINTEDLQDREEIRVGARIAFAKYWSIFGSTIIDLTSRGEAPQSAGDGFAPVRTRVGVLYDDECLRIGLTWRRDYIADRDFRRGDSYLISLAFKNLGR